MAEKSVIFSLRVSPVLIERVKAVTDNRNQFFIEAAEEKLSPVKREALTRREQKEVLRGAKKLDDLMRDAILQEAETRKGFLSGMSNEDFARLVASRLPKEESSDSGLEADVLSLQECLASLPGIEDITKELSRVKGLLFKAEHERDVNFKLLKYAKGVDPDRIELMDAMYRFAVEYAVGLVARAALPGFGDGGGLTEKGYADIAKQVKADFEKLTICRRGSR